jgi:hypothetical protein
VHAYASRRFNAAEDLALDVVGEIVAAIPMDRWIQIAQNARPHGKKR